MVLYYVVLMSVFLLFSQVYNSPSFNGQADGSSYTSTEMPNQISKYTGGGGGEVGGGGGGLHQELYLHCTSV